MTINRRRFVKAAATLPVVALPGCLPGSESGGADSAGRAIERQLPPSTLRAVAEVVLPAELGPAGLEQAVVGFEAWLAGYQPVVERDHGYGTGEIRYTGPDPSPGWRAQLEAYDLEARQRMGVAFAEMDRAERESFIRGQLRSEQSLAGAAQARSVALGLVSWWASSPAALDLCHGVSIRRQTCRPLAEVADRPQPLSGSG